MQQLSAARKAAFAILRAVERGDAHSDDLLRSKSVAKLSAADKNLTTALVLGVLRRQIVLDGRIRPLLKKPNAKLDLEVLIALRLGAFQLLHMDRIPARAAIDESVELAKHAGHRFASGMVNAVLRKIAADASRQGASSFAPRSPSTEARTLAPAQTAGDETAAYPEWMYERWRSQFGEKTACEVCRYGQSQPVVALRLASPEVERELADAGVELAPGVLLSAARIVASGDIFAAAALREGRARVQDEGSQLVAEIAGKGSAILDCCAAPGGKTLILAQRNPQARIVACEASGPRLDALRARLESAGDRIECRHADATQLQYGNEFDLVLADVPCSGTGTLGRNPEIRHRLREAEFVRQAERQRAILHSALRAARPGGRVVYSTCSLEAEENEQVVGAVLQQRPDARVVPIEARLGELEQQGILSAGVAAKLKQCVTPEGYLRLFPGAFGTDGFFIAVIEHTV